MTFLRFAPVEAPAVSENTAKYQGSGGIKAPESLIQPVESLLVGPDGKPS